MVQSACYGQQEEDLDKGQAHPQDAFGHKKSFYPQRRYQEGTQRTGAYFDSNEAEQTENFGGQHKNHKEGQQPVTVGDLLTAPINAQHFLRIGYRPM